MQPPQSGASPHPMLIFHTITILHTSTNTAFNALFFLIPMRDLIRLHPEIIWHIITSYHKLQFRCLSWEVYFILASSAGQTLKNDWKQRKSGLPEPLYYNVTKKKKGEGGKGEKARSSSEYRILTSTSSQLSKRATHPDRALLTFISTKHELWW